MNKKITSISEMYIDEDGILRVKIFKNATVDLVSIKENYAAFKELLGNNRVLLLIDSRVKYKFTKEARIYAASNAITLNRVATAFLVSSFMSRFIANAYIILNKPVIPTKMFTSEASALEWLKSFYVLPGDKFERPKK